MDIIINPIFHFHEQTKQIEVLCHFEQNEVITLSRSKLTATYAGLRDWLGDIFTKALRKNISSFLVKDRISRDM